MILKLKTDQMNVRAGDILISNPLMCEPYFKYSVVLIVTIDKKYGCIGLILNKLEHNILKFENIKFKVFEGGPLSKASIFPLHTMGTEIPESVNIVGNLFFGGDEKIIDDRCMEGLVNRTEIKFFMGYCGWDGGQLEKELSNETWIVAEADVEYVMQMRYDNLWQNCIKKIGKEYSYLLHLSPVINDEVILKEGE